MLEPIVAQRIARCEIDPLSHENYTELRERRRELKESQEPPQVIQPQYKLDLETPREPKKVVVPFNFQK